MNRRRVWERLERPAMLQGVTQQLQQLPLRPRTRVLATGTNAGAIGRMLAARHAMVDVIGIDRDPDYVAYATSRASAERLGNLTFQTGDLEALPLPDGAVDAVWSNLSLHPLPRPDRAVREFRRVLRPGGTLLAVLHESFMLTNFPEDDDLRVRLARVLPGLADFRLARNLPLHLRDGGFDDISVAAAMDPTYSALGRIGPDQRRNLDEVLALAMPRLAQILGGAEEAARFRTDLLAYCDRSDTYSYAPLWVFRGVAANDGQPVSNPEATPRADAIADELDRAPTTWFFAAVIAMSLWLLLLYLAGLFS